MKKLQFQYGKEINLPRRLAGGIGETRELPEADARRLAGDGYGQIVTAAAPKPPAKPTAPAEAPSK